MSIVKCRLKTPERDREANCTGVEIILRKQNIVASEPKIDSMIKSHFYIILVQNCQLIAMKMHLPYVMLLQENHIWCSN